MVKRVKVTYFLFLDVTGGQVMGNPVVPVISLIPGHLTSDEEILLYDVKRAYSKLVNHGSLKGLYTS